MIETIRRWLARYPVFKEVIVNTKSGRAFRGVLWWKRREFLVLRNAEMLREKEETIRMDGEVVIPADNVDFLQVVR